MSYSRMANATLPSALQRFTSVFGMGYRWFHCAIAARQNLQSKKLNYSFSANKLQNFLGVVWLSPHGSLVWVSSTYHRAYTPTYQRRSLQRPFSGLKVQG